MSPLLFLILFVLIEQISSKQISTTIPLSQSDPWKYVTKFSMISGRGSFKIRAQLVSARGEDFKPIQVVSNIFMDVNWPNVLEEVSCVDKYRGASTHYTLDMPNNGAWSRE